MTKCITILLSSALLLFVVNLVRKEKLTFKYAFGWIVVSIIAIILTLFDQLIFSLASLLGFELASNFIFFSLLTIFIFLSLLMTIFLCQQNNRNDTMAQKIAVLQHELDELKKNQ